MTETDFELFESVVDEFRRSLETILGNCKNRKVHRALMELIEDCARAEEVVFLHRN